MRIWIINPFDDLPCEGKAQRFWSLSETLADQGHEVIWWSSDWSHRRKAKRVGLEDLKVGRCESENPLRSLSYAGQEGGELGGTTTNDQRSTSNSASLPRRRIERISRWLESGIIGCLGVRCIGMPALRLIRVLWPNRMSS
jgi:hypothetical protein